MWAREPKDSDGNRPGLKESRRWTEGYERVAERAEELPGVRLVYVADRESDLFEKNPRCFSTGSVKTPFSMAYLRFWANPPNVLSIL